jgi:hypothetical protein
MKLKLNSLIVSSGLMIFAVFDTNAQLDRLKGAAKGAIDKKTSDVATSAVDKANVGKYKIEAVPDNGIINDLHRSNVGKVVFSNAEIVKDATSSSNFKNSFNLGDDIYSRVYLDKSFTNEGNSIGYISQFTDFHLRMTVEGQKFDVLPNTKIDPSGVQQPCLIEGPWGYPLSKVAEDPEIKDKWTTFQIAISPKQTEVKDYPSAEYRDFFYRMYQLPVGKHKVKLEVVFDIPCDEVNKGNYGTDPDTGRKWSTKFGPEKVLAAGEFEINVTEAGKIACGKKICPTLDWLSYKLIKVPNGQQMVSTAKRDGETILKVVEIHNDWTYQRNVFGVILSRTIGGKALVQNINTKLCYEVDIVFSQENISSGGDKYADTKFSRSGSFENNNVLFLRDCTGL